MRMRLSISIDKVDPLRQCTRDESLLEPQQNPSNSL